MDKSEFNSSIKLACDWLTDVAQVKTDDLPVDTHDKVGFGYASWKGSIRGEYSVAEKTWWYYCPVWHTGQAVKSLLLAADFLGEQKYLQAARMGADFIYANQVWDQTNPDHGLILAFEDHRDKTNTSAIMECMDGLMLLADKIESQHMWDRLIAAGHFIVDKLYMPEVGLFRDCYDPNTHSVVLPNPYVTKNNIGGRPLIEDGILVRLYDKMYSPQSLGQSGSHKASY